MPGALTELISLRIEASKREAWQVQSWPWRQTSKCNRSYVSPDAEEKRGLSDDAIHKIREVKQSIGALPKLEGRGPLFD